MKINGKANPYDFGSYAATSALARVAADASNHIKDPEQAEQFQMDVLDSLSREVGPDPELRSLSYDAKRDAEVLTYRTGEKANYTHGLNQIAGIFSQNAIQAATGPVGFGMGPDLDKVLQNGIALKKESPTSAQLKEMAIRSVPGSTAVHADQLANATESLDTATQQKVHGAYFKEFGYISEVGSYNRELTVPPYMRTEGS